MTEDSILLRLKIILGTMNQPHYGDVDTQLDNYLDAKIELAELITLLEEEE